MVLQSTPRVPLEGQSSDQIQSMSVPSREPTKDHEKIHPDANQQAGDGQNIKGVRFVLLLICLYLGNFLVGYDSSCIGTLTPVITDEFHALNDLGWYQTAYLVTLCASMLIYGQLYTFYSMKMLYIAALTIFIIGSVLTAAAPSSASFIVGRALGGLGAAGINSGTSIIIAHTTSLERRPMWFGISGGLECAALAFGPLISGTIAHYTAWRVSFYIVIPLAVAILVMIFFSIGDLRQAEKTPLSRKERLVRIDWPGLVIELLMTTCLVLGLQWAGTTYHWSNWRIILLLTMVGVLLMVFLFAEDRAGENSMVSLTMLCQRTVAFASLTTFCNFAALWVLSFYLPLYFQAVRRASTLSSGLMYLPLALAMSVSAFLGGPLTTYIGYYTPVMIFGSSLTVVGTGLITTFRPDLPAANWIGYQIIYGIGIGLGFQPPFLAIQAVLQGPAVPAALVLLNFVQVLGGIIVLSIAQNVFLTRLVRSLATVLPQLDRNTVLLNNGAVGLVDSVSAEHRGQVIASYNHALRDVFYISLGLSCVALLSTLGIQTKRIREKEIREMAELDTTIVNSS